MHKRYWKIWGNRSHNSNIFYDHINIDFIGLEIKNKAKAIYCIVFDIIRDSHEVLKILEGKKTKRSLEIIFFKRSKSDLFTYLTDVSGHIISPESR